MHCLEHGIYAISLNDFVRGSHQENKLTPNERMRLVNNAQLTADESKLVRTEFERVRSLPEWVTRIPAGLLCRSFALSHCICRFQCLN